MLAPIAGFSFGFEVLPDGIAGKPEIPGNGADALALDQVASTQLDDGFHA